MSKKMTFEEAQEWLAGICEKARNGEFSDGVYYTEPNESGLSIVIGWTEGYEEDWSLGQLVSDIDGKKVCWTLCGKVAYNCNDLQCDFEYDWYMPIAPDDNGEVYDTCIAIKSEHDMEYLWNELEFATEEMKKGRLVRAEKGDK